MVAVKNVPVKKQLRAKIIAILEDKRDLILDQHHDAYCRHLNMIDKKSRGVDDLEKVCMPVRTRFSIILDKFIEVMKTENGDYSYDLAESEKDIQYALKFVVPRQRRSLDYR